MISVIITTHANRADVCKRAIESVLHQTYSDVEIIVVDDASTDNTEEVVKGIGDPRIKYFKRKRSRGLQGICKNKGIRESKGEFIAFLDSDNVYRPDHLKCLYLQFERNLAQKLDVVYGDRWLIRGKETGIGIYEDFSLPRLLDHNYIDTSDALIRREALYAIGGWDERYKRFADWNLFLRMAKAGFQFKRITQILTDYYIREDSISNDPVTDMWNPFDIEICQPYLRDIPIIKVALYTITYDRLGYTKKSFESLKSTAGYPFEHFVVDNGSSDGTPSWLEKNFDEKHIILNKDNKGISIASNQALELIKRSGEYDVIVKFDNDCMCLTPNWLDKMVEIYKSNHLLALSPYVQGLKDMPGGAPRLGYGRIRGELVGLTQHLGGICHFVSAKAYEGWKWNENEQLHGMQDLEFSQWITKLGYQMAYLENFFVSHGPQGTEAQQKDFPEYFERRKAEKIKAYGK
jgi:glycosyltransferase involved in cell wall biosynthesis